MKRFENALLIWEGGACNARAVSVALTAAIDEVRAEQLDVRQDAACKLIADQLCQLLGLPNPLVDVGSLEVEKIRSECASRVGRTVKSC